MRLILLACLFLGMGTLHAGDFSPGCYRELQTSFFDSRIVMEALQLHYVPQTSWAPIVRALNLASQRVPGIIRAEAARMQPNPLDPQFLAEPAVGLLRSVLQTVFVQVLSSFNVNQESKINQGDIQAMFDYIALKQANRLERCFGLPKPLH